MSHDVVRVQTTRVDVVRVPVPAPQVVTAPGPTAAVSVRDRVDVVRVPSQPTQVVTTGSGAIGPPGPPGPPGVPGGAPPFEQTFAAPSAEWVIQHNLGAYPAVTLVDFADEEFTGDISYPDVDTVVVRFAKPLTGLARMRV